MNSKSDFSSRDSMSSGGEIESIAERILMLNNKTVGDIMTPKISIYAKDLDSVLIDIANYMCTHKLTRLPLYEDNIDNPIGFLHVKDVLFLVLNEDVHKSIKNYKSFFRDLLYVPPFMPLDRLFSILKAGPTIAMIVDEYGGTKGIATIHDVIRYAMGDVHDEFSRDTPSVSIVEENKWLCDPRISIENLKDVLPRHIYEILSSEYDSVESLGGFVFSLAGYVPKKGDIIKHRVGLIFEIIDSDQRRIKSLVMKFVDKSLDE